MFWEESLIKERKISEMIKNTIIFIFLLIFTFYFIYPTFYFFINKNTFKELVKDCLNSERFISMLDEITENESVDTKVNVFLNAKFNQTFCADMIVRENEMISYGVSKEKIDLIKSEVIGENTNLINFYY